MAGVAAAALIGCGGASIDSHRLAADLAKAISTDQHGSRLSHVTCTRRTGSVFDCAGDYVASRGYVKQTLGAVETADFKAADWKVLQQQQSGPRTFTVTVSGDGSFTYRPQ